MKIYKYPLVRTAEQIIQMPRGAKPLAVQMQGEAPCIWALVEPEEQLERRLVWIFGTGHEIPSIIQKMQYLGTFQEMRGMLVWHVFVNGGVDS